MFELLINVLPLAIGSCLSPVIFGLMLSILGNPAHTKTRAFALLFGAVAVAIFLALIGYALSTEYFTPKESNNSGPIDIAIGIIFLLFAASSFFFKPNAKQDGLKKLNKSSSHAIRFFLLGVLINITNFDAVALYTGAIKETFEYATSFLPALIFVIISSLFFLLPEILPLAVYLFYPKKTKQILDPVRKLTVKYGSIILTVLFTIFGIYFLLKGLGQ